MVPDTFQNRCREALEQAFLHHPRETGETYLQHLWFTVNMSSRFMLCGAVLLVHGLMPFLFTRTASSQVAQINAIMKKRGNNAAKTEPERP